MTAMLQVLILVVMEYTQWGLWLRHRVWLVVLILVVMEYTQWEWMLLKKHVNIFVLILVVMEYTQWVDIYRGSELLESS